MKLNAEQQWIVKHLFMNIMQMLKSFAKALPFGILAGVISYLIINHKHKNIKFIRPDKRENAIILFSTYITILLQMALFGRRIGTVHKVEMIPFNVPGGMRYVVLYSLANALIFMPVGILVPMIWKKLCKMHDVIIIGFLISLVIEVLQLLLQCGMFQTEDMIMNTVGAAIGYIVWKKADIKKNQQN